MSTKTSTPAVAGGILLECVGGPLDGELIFLSHSDSVVDVGHFGDERRTPWIKGARPGDPHFLGWYSPDSFENGAAAHWHAFASPAAAPQGAEREG